MLTYCCLMSVCFKSRTSFSISFNVDPVVMNSYTFCLPGKCLFFLHFWRTVFLDIVFLIDLFFSFSTLNLSNYSLLDCNISAKKSDSLMKIVHNWLLFSCYFHNFLFDFLQFDYNVSYVNLRGSSYLVTFGLLGFGHFLLHICEVFSHYFFEYAFWSFLSLLFIWLL